MIYLDNAATTKMYEGAYNKMLPYFRDVFANPNASYSYAGDIRREIERVRLQIAESIGAKEEEIFFTSGGSESDNWAIRGVAARTKKRHIISVVTEHHAVLNTLKDLEKEGFDITLLGVDKDGFINVDELKQAVRNDTALVTVMTANNEIGNIQPIAEIGEFLKVKDVIFHTDAVQAYGHIPIDVNIMGVDLLSASGHKFYGPKGVGYIYIRKGTDIAPLITGGAQQDKMRAGTLNVPGIIGMGEAAKYVGDNLRQNMLIEQEIRDYMITEILEKVEGTFVNGSRLNRLPGNINICFPGVDGERLVSLLEHDGIICSNSAACVEHGTEYSHVLKAIGVAPKDIKASLRITLSKDTSKEDVDYTVSKIVERVRLLRMVSDL